MRPRSILVQDFVASSPIAAGKLLVSTPVPYHAFFLVDI